MEPDGGSSSCEIKTETEAKRDPVSPGAPAVIGLGEAVVMQVESEGKTRGFLVAAGFENGGMPGEITLCEVRYLLAGRKRFEIASADRILVSRDSDFLWSAIDPGAVALVPCPTPTAYPLDFISTHGFRWVRRLFRQGRYIKLMMHLGGRFRTTRFVTNRSIIDEAGPPFSELPLIRSRPIPRALER